MSEVKRYGHIGYLVNASDKLIELYPDMTVYVKAADFDRVTAERDAALASVESAAASAQTLHEVISRLRSERDALQQRLTAADERADVLEGLLRDVSGRGRVVRWELGLMDQIDDALKDFCPSCNGAGWANQGCVDLCVNCNGSGMAALKAAEGGGDE